MIREYIIKISDEIMEEEIADRPQELVRCKDCMYAHLTYDGECKYCDLDEDENGFIEATYRPGDWFCADGERKKERDCGQVAK